LLGEILPGYYRLAEQVWDNLPVARVSRLLADLSHLDANAAKLKPTIRKQKAEKRKQKAKMRLRLGLRLRLGTAPGPPNLKPELEPDLF
jgi:hypothetical protein